MKPNRAQADKHNKPPQSQPRKTPQRNKNKNKGRAKQEAPEENHSSPQKEHTFHNSKPNQNRQH